MKIDSEGEISDFEFESSQAASVSDLQTDKSVAVPIIEEEEIEPFDALSLPMKPNYLKVGNVISDLHNLLIVKTGTGEERVLQVGSVVFDSSKLAIGRITDIWGPVKDPLYTVTKFKNSAPSTNDSASSTQTQSLNDSTVINSQTLGNELKVEKQPESLGNEAALDIQLQSIGCDDIISQDTEFTCVVDCQNSTKLEESQIDKNLGSAKDIDSDYGIKTPEVVLSRTKDQSMVGEVVFYISDLSEVVFTAPLKALKGTDASNLYDNEAEHPEFSDDEEERAYKMSLKKSQQRQSPITNAMSPENKIPLKRKGNESFQKRQQRNLLQSNSPSLHKVNNRSQVRPPVFMPQESNADFYPNNVDYGLKNQLNVHHQSIYRPQQFQAQGRGFRSALQLEAQAKLQAQIQASQYQSQMEKVMHVPVTRKATTSFPLPAKIQLNSVPTSNQSEYENLKQQDSVNSFQSPPHSQGFPFLQEGCQKPLQSTTAFPHYNQQVIQQQYGQERQQQFHQPQHQLFHQSNQHSIHQSSQSRITSDFNSTSDQVTMYPGNESFYSSTNREHLHQQKSLPNYYPTPQPSPVPPVSEDQMKKLEELARFLRQQ